MSIRRLGVVVAGAALAFGVPTAALAGTAGPASHARPAAHAAKASTYIVPTGGVTMLKIAKSTASVLTSNGISVTLASEARNTDSGIAFPIQGGLINAKTLAGRITHAGGLTFRAGGKSLTVRDFTINTKKATLSGYVDEARARVLVLDLNFAKASIKATSKTLSVRNVGATLDKQAAGELNGYFGTSLFKGGLPIGTARVSATIAVVTR